MSLEIGKILTLTPEKWVQNGYTLARAPGDFPVFIHGALPGEEIRARIVKARAAHAFGATLEVLKAADERIDPDCPAFPACGGCSFRHMDYAREIELKRRLLGEFKFLRDGLKAAEAPFFSSPPRAYRGAVQVHRDESGQVGFFAPNSNEIAPLPPNGCDLLSPELNRALGEYRFANVRGKFPFRQSEEHVLGPEELTGEKKTARIALTGPGGEFWSWSFPAAGFFQANRFLLKDWLDFIRDSVGASRPRTVELFCGSALIGGYARDLLGEYQGLESFAPAVRRARENFKKRDFAGSFEIEDLYRRAPAFPGTELVIANPPRAGLKRRLTEAIAAARPGAVIYSSCNPATLNRDLGALFQAGYRLERGAIFDFFPRTYHLEMVAVLRHDSSKR